MIIDELIITLGLDPKGIDRDSKKAANALLNTQKQLESGAKSAEAGAKRMFEAYSAVQQRVLGLFALFVGGRGAKEFTAWQIGTAADTGRMARAFDTSSEKLSKWKNTADVAGGSAEGMQQSIGNLATEIERFSLTGESGMIPWFRALNIEITKAGKARDFEDVFLDLADKFSKMGGARATVFGQALGLDQGTINLLMKGRVGVSLLLEEQKKLNIVTKDQADEAERAQKAWRQMEQAATGFGNVLINLVAPTIASLLNNTTQMITTLRHTPEERAKYEAEELKKSGGKTSSERSREQFGEPPAWMKDGITRLFGLAPDALDSKTGRTTRGDDHLFNNGIPKEGRALLGGIAAGESGGKYNVMYGGGTFSDMSKHPNQRNLITSGPNAGQYSTAAGKYQMLHSTWSDAQKALGLKDFGEESQDKAAWFIAQRDYKARTGRDLLADLQANDPAKRAAIAGGLKQTWTSLPGGIEQGRHASKFSDAITFAKSSALAPAAGSSSGVSNDVSNDVRIGTINVHTRATDAEGIGKAIGPVVRDELAVQANGGAM